MRRKASELTIQCATVDYVVRKRGTSVTREKQGEKKNRKDWKTLINVPCSFSRFHIGFALLQCQNFAFFARTHFFYKSNSFWRMECNQILGCLSALAWRLHFFLYFTLSRILSCIERWVITFHRCKSPLILSVPQQTLPNLILNFYSVFLFIKKFSQAGLPGIEENDLSSNPPLIASIYETRYIR